MLAEDSLWQRVHVEAGAAAHLTGQGAMPVYRSPDRTTAADRIELSVADGGVLEYLPEPRILFPHSRIDQTMVVRAGPGGIAIVADGFLAYDPDGAAGRSVAIAARSSSSARTARSAHATASRWTPRRCGGAHAHGSRPLAH